MPETYTEEELAKAWAELDTVSVDWNRKNLARICVQARKNRLWEAHGNGGNGPESVFVQAARLGGDWTEEG